MDPEDRRTAIVASTLPLLRECGPGAVSTRQIAAAAGVAEGTIFRAFPDKAALLRAVVLAALDPAPLVAELAAIDPTADLRTRLGRALELLVGMFSDNVRLLVYARQTFLELGPDDKAACAVRDGRRAVHQAVAHVLEPDRDRLRLSPERAARLVVSLAVSSVHAPLNDEPLSPAEIADTLLDGLLLPETAGRTTRSSDLRV
jgi:AcrR family transcriptional regulator